MTTNDGGVVSPAGFVFGVTLRDYFAAQALLMVFVVCDNNDSETSNEGAAKIAYSVADAMLAERAKA